MPFPGRLVRFRLSGTVRASTTLRGADDSKAPCILRASHVEVPGGFHLIEIRIARRRNKCSVVAPLSAVVGWEQAIEASLRWKPLKRQAVGSPLDTFLLPGLQYESLGASLTFGPIRGGVRFVIQQTGPRSLTCILSQEAAQDLSTFIKHILHHSSPHQDGS